MPLFSSKEEHFYKGKVANACCLERLQATNKHVHGCGQIGGGGVLLATAMSQGAELLRLLKDRSEALFPPLAKMSLTL